MYGLLPQVTNVALNLLSFRLLLVRHGEVNERFDGIQPFRFMFLNELKLIWRQQALKDAESLPGVLGNTRTGAFIFREQGTFSLL